MNWPPSSTLARAMALPIALVFMVPSLTAEDSDPGLLSNEPLGAAVGKPSVLMPETRSNGNLGPWSDRGDRFTDWSWCGYRGGGVRLPRYPVVRRLDPSGGMDDGPAIQAALDAMASMPPGSDGVRGALLLTKGRYRVGLPLTNRASGVVLRGEGEGEDGTVLVATLRRMHNLLTFAAPLPSGSRPGAPAVSDSSRSTNVYRFADPWVPCGGTVFRVEGLPPDAFRPGDEVEISRPGTDAWVKALGMDRFPPRSDGAPTKPWTARGMTLVFRNQIVSTTPDSIRVRVPVPQNFEGIFGGGTVRLAPPLPLVRECGVESLRMESEYDPALQGDAPVKHHNDEAHGWIGIVFQSAADSWVRNVTTRFMAMGAVQVPKPSTRITIVDSRCLDPVSKIMGGRRYSFWLGGSESLVYRCFTRGGRHDYAIDAKTPGPNAFVDCVAEQCYATSEPHHRWGVGSLYDNVTIRGSTGGLVVANRGSMGDGHGWAGNHTLFWNCEAPLMISMAPPTGMNFILGVRQAKATPAATFSMEMKLYESVSGVPCEARDGIAQGNGWIESPARPVEPRSLYFSQLRARLGSAAVGEVGEP